MSKPNFQDPGPGANAFVISPDDNNDLPSRVRGVYVAASGDLKVTMAENGTVITFTSVASGIVHPIAAIRVHSTGTTATGLIGLF